MTRQENIAIITGGGQGIGKCIARRFLQEGMKVVIAEIDEEAGRETQAELEQVGEIMFVPCDVAEEGEVKAMVRQTIKEFGRVDILVNNAAIGISKPVEKLKLAEWNRVLAVNLTGPFLCAKYAAPYLKETGGVIINIASTRALMSEPDTEAYSASKGGLHALTHALAISLGPEIRVNCISPGWIETSEWQKRSARREPDLDEEDETQHPAGRVGAPEDIASLALFLATEENSFITGANFVVDGGMTRKMIYL
jgi:NAD(P)-dependent dehydrogenase (short-subunit alcohol dehydrogenase family)